MGVQLNIKNEEARALAEQIAAETGVSITEAVTTALRDRLAKLTRERDPAPGSLRDRELAFYRQIEGSRSHWRGAMLSLDHGDILYDEYGLPR